MEYLIGGLIGIVIILFFQLIVRKSYQHGYQQGNKNSILTIIETIKKNGKVDITIDNKKTTLSEVKIPTRTPPTVINKKE